VWPLVLVIIEQMTMTQMQVEQQPAAVHACELNNSVAQFGNNSRWVVQHALAKV
jgi:hypothetical protein